MQDNSTKKSLSNLFFAIAGLCGGVIIVTLALLYTNSVWGYISNMAFIYKLYEYVTTYGLIVTAGAAGLGLTVRLNAILFIVFAVIVAIVVVFKFFPAVRDELITRLCIAIL
ncbi:MAG: hypothetical protein FWE62_04755 [Firmicutes bacterium]|nr:hypothetical protein [Bacillota bacterium]